MKRRTIENIVKYGLVGTAGLALILYWGLSFFNPRDGLEEVLSREHFSNGTPQKVLTKYENMTSNYSVGLLYPSNNPITEVDRPKEVKPTDCWRFETRYDDAKKQIVTLYTHRRGQKQDNPLVAEDREYTFQLNCPYNTKSVRVSYNGIEKEIRLLFDKETNKLVALSTLTAVKSQKHLSVVVDYHNGVKDKFDIQVTGE